MSQQYANDIDYSDLLEALRQTQQPCILAVDDDPDIQRLIEHILGREEVRVRTASSAREAWKIISSNTPDLVLLDIDMPDVDGWSLCKAIREQPRFKDLRIIFLTAHATDADMVTGLNMGADDYITKPFNKKALVARVLAKVR